MNRRQSMGTMTKGLFSSFLDTYTSVTRNLETPSFNHFLEAET